MDYKTCQLDFDENDYDAMGCTDAKSRNIEKKCYNLLITMCKHKGIEDISWTNPEVKSLYDKIITENGRVDEEIECPVCYDTIKPGKGVKCEHGHSVCERHFIERAKSIYSEGKFAFQDDECSLQRCFMCRVDMPDELFSKQYFKLLHITQIFGMGKAHGLTNEDNHNVYEDSNKIMKNVRGY
jgi:hypothetical protein